MKVLAEKKTKWGKYYGFCFLVAVIFLYFLLFFFDPEGAYNSLKASGNIFIRIIPVLLLVILFMALINYFLHPKTVAKYAGERSGIKIKIPLLPLLVYYFGALFVVVLLPYIVIASLIEGEIIEIIERRKR